jgi:hypothetical protein
MRRANALMRVLFVLIAACALLGALVVLVEPFPQPYAPLNGAELPEWQGIVVGRSTIDEVQALVGAPVEHEESTPVLLLPLRKLAHGNMKWWTFSDQSCSSYSTISVASSRTDDIVQYVEPCTYSELLPAVGTYPPTLGQLLNVYGEPERVTWSDIDDYDRLYIWASRGVAAKAGVPAWQGEGHATFLFSVEYFVPTDVATYLATWKKYYFPKKGYGEEDAYHNPAHPYPLSVIDQIK